MRDELRNATGMDAISLNSLCFFSINKTANFYFKCD
jgi:hypothetical protein